MVDVKLRYIPCDKSKLLEDQTEFVGTLSLPADKMLVDFPAENVDAIIIDEVAKEYALEFPTAHYNLKTRVSIGTVQEGIQLVQSLGCELPEWFDVLKGVDSDDY